MDSWVLEGDSYSFLRSAPRNFNLQHLDGPNQVEIFDITSIPSHRSAISETTCLCDIFGDDCESPALSSSPASASFLKKDVDEQLPGEDANDSSGSYHTANGSEHGSDTFEDSKDTKEPLLSETMESNTLASGLTFQNTQSEVPSEQGSTKPSGNRQESYPFQDPSLAQIENSSDHQQLVTSTSEFRDTNIRVTGSTQERIPSPESLSANEDISDKSQFTSSGLRDIDSTDEIITPDDIRIVKQMDASSSDSTQKIISPEFSTESRSIPEQTHTTTCEVRETDPTQDNIQCMFSDNRESSESFSDWASEDSPEENSDLRCFGKEEKVSLPDIIPPENSFLVHESVQSNSVALINFSNDGSDVPPLQTATFDSSKEDHREILALMEHEDVPSTSAHIGRVLCDDKPELSDWEDPNTAPPPTYIEDNTEIDVASLPQHLPVSSVTVETVILPEHRASSSFSDTTEGLISCMISEVCSTSGSSVDVNSSVSTVVIHSPVGFTICPSPEPKNKIWSAEPEDLKFTPESPECDYRLTPTDEGSFSSFDSKLCPTPEPRSITSTPESNQNAFIYELTPAASSTEMSSPEFNIMSCSSLTQDLLSNQIEQKATQNDFSSPNEVLVRTQDEEGIIHAESCKGTKDVVDMNISTIYNLSSTQGTICIPSTILSRDNVSPDLNRTKHIEASNILPTNEIANMPSNLSSMDMCIISPNSPVSIPRNTESPGVHEIRSVENSDITDMAISSLSNLSSTDEAVSRSPPNLYIPLDTASSDVVGTRSTESYMSATFPTKDTENVVYSPILQPSSTERGTSRPPGNLEAPSDTVYPDLDGIIYEKNPASTTVLTNETTIMAISPLSNRSPSVDGDTVSSVGTRSMESSISTIPPINETRNMVISPISDLSSTERSICRPSSTSTIPRNTAFPDIDGIECVEIPTTTAVHTKEMTNMANVPINLSLTGAISTPPLNFSIPRDTMCLDLQETTHMEQSIAIPTNETSTMAISPISDLSSTAGDISRPSSTTTTSRNTASTDVGRLTCVETSISTIQPKHEASIQGMSPVFNISPVQGGLLNPPSTLVIPSYAMSLDLEGTIYTEISNEIPIKDITNVVDSFIPKLSTGGCISRPLSTLSIPGDTVCLDEDGIRNVKSSTSNIIPTNNTISPVHSRSSAEEGVSIQPSNLSIPRDTTSPKVEGPSNNETSNEIPTTETINVDSSISNLTTLSDRVPQRSSDKFNDYIPAPELCIPLEYSSDNRLSKSAREKVNLPLTVQDVGQTDDTDYKMPLKSCSLPQDDCTNIASLPCNQPNKINGPPPEPPSPRLSVKQIKESWERMNESILNSLSPWQTPKKSVTVPNAKDVKEGGKEILEKGSAGSEKTFGKFVMRPGESPTVLPSNNHGVYGGQTGRYKGWSGERVIQEEHTLGKGVGNTAKGSYRGEQVELSFSTRNRKGSANHSPSPSSRDPKSGIPPRYFESPLATRRQQSVLRAQNLQNKTGVRRVRSTSQTNQRGAGCLSSECTTETSSMGSEFDEADSEVKWFTDQAFRSLSSPQVDYMDVYNSSCGSSMNFSQPSTVDSPGSAAWISYTDLHDSLHENDDVLCHSSSFSPHGTLEPVKQIEMGSFECVDVALENKEKTGIGKRMVPKRQIQFKRRNFDELKFTENDEKAMDSLSTQTCSKDTFVRQHSTPASIQDLVQGDHQIQTSKKMLQKSSSLDESSTKSKMASSVIKSVLSKKMDTATKESSQRELCSSLQSDCSLSSEDISDERSPHLQKRSYRPKVPPKPVFKANCLPFTYNPTDAVLNSNTLVNDQIRPTLDDSFQSKLSKKQDFGISEMEAVMVGEKLNSDPGSTISQTPNCTAICITSTQNRITNSDNGHPMTLETHKQQDCSSSMFLSKTPEITLKPCTSKDTNESSLSASLWPELEASKDTIKNLKEVPQVEEKLEERIRVKTEAEADPEEDHEKNKPKYVLHKVRDVRKLVKNSYNLSFKASNVSHHVEDAAPEKQKEMQSDNLHPLHIECKAISWKDKTTSCNKSTTYQDVAHHTADESKMPQVDSPNRRHVGTTKITTNAPLPNVQLSDVDKCNSIPKSDNCEQSAKLEMPSRPPSKEVATLVFLQDGTPKSMHQPKHPTCTEAKTANSSHSVSMLRKEKGMQADIGVCEDLSEGVGAKPKHINILKVPLQPYASDGTPCESQIVKKEDAGLNNGLQTSESNLQIRSSPKPKEVKVYPNAKVGDNKIQRDLLQPRKEQEITADSSSKTEVRVFSSNTKLNAMPVTTSKEIELPIQVRSISSDRPKPSVLPKPNYKQPFAEIRSSSHDFPKTDFPPTSTLKEQTHLKSDGKLIETSATVMHNEQSNTTASSNAKALAVSAVSSHIPQTIALTAMSVSAQKSTATTGRQEVSITSGQNSSDWQEQNIQEPLIPTTSYAPNYQSLPEVSHANTHTQLPMTASCNNELNRDDFHFPASDDPPSYDERESFSPLQLSDLPPRRQNRYHPSTKHSLCSCTSCTHPQFGQPYPNQTPPVPCSPGQIISYPGAPPQAQVRPHQCKPDGQSSSYPSDSPKTTVQQAPAMIQPMHHSHACPAPVIQPYGNEQQQQQQPSTQHMDRCSGSQRSPQAPSGATYREPDRSPNIAALDPRTQFFSPRELPPAFAHEFGSDATGGGGVLYPENTSGLGYGPAQRRVLLDPETGKYFYIEVPMQPLRKMLFDPEIGQYVEVLIPQQAMSNSSMYPPTAAPYQGPYHGQGLYTSQYLPYAMPPHPQSAQQPRHPEPSVPTSLHQNTMGYGSSASQAPKSDVKGHPSLDQSYLESMYYIPTGMNASPNSTPSDCYHKPATNMPAVGGRRA